jgi:hypothetical protein
MDEDLKRVLEEMRLENAAAHAETRRQIDATAGAIRRENAAAHGETRRHFDVAAEGLRHEIKLAAESVVQLGEKLDRAETRLDEKIDRTTAETQGMIRVSHGELDRRLRTLDERDGSAH